MKFERVNTLFDWLMWLSAIAVGFCTLFGAATITYGDGGFKVTEGGYSSGPAFRVTYDNPWFPPKPPPPPPPPQQSADERPVVEFLSAEWCGPCKVAKAALTVKVREKLPFRIRDRDVDKEGWQGESGIPVFRWETPTGPMHIGWHSVDNLVSEWKRTTTKVKTVQPQASTRNRWPSMAGYRARWTWPHKQSLADHLRTTHGVNEAYQLNQDQLEAVHDALHEGYSLQQIRNRYGR